MIGVDKLANIVKVTLGLGVGAILGDKVSGKP